MKQNKIAIFVTAPMAFVSLLLAFLLYPHDGQGVFWSNVLLGVFGSSLLGLITAIINYTTERKNTIDAFFMHHIKAANNFRRFLNNHSLFETGNIDITIETILRMAEFDHLPLDEAFRNMSFIHRNKKKRNQIFEQMYKPIVDLNHKVLNTAQLIEQYRMSSILSDQRKKDLIDLLNNCFELDIAASITLKEGQTVQLSHVIRKLHENEDEFYNTYMSPKKEMKEHK